MIIGIDPGVSGGIAFAADDGIQAAQLRLPSQYSVIKMPETESDIAAVLRPYYEIATAYLEYVTAMPKQGVSSTFKFGKNYGTLLGILAALKVRRVHVRPATWQRELGCLSKGDKNVTKRRAQELFPKLKVIHATADALLIAEYGRRRELGLCRR